MENNSDYRNTQMEQSVDTEACNIAKEIYMKYNPEMQKQICQRIYQVYESTGLMEYRLHKRTYLACFS